MGLWLYGLAPPVLLTGAGSTAKQPEGHGEGKAPWPQRGCPHASVLPVLAKPGGAAAEGPRGGALSFPLLGQVFLGAGLRLLREAP